MLIQIENEEQYETAISRIYDLMQKGLKASLTKFDELNMLSILVKEYEAYYYPISKLSEKHFISNNDLNQKINQRDEAFMQKKMKLIMRKELTERLNDRRNA